MCGIVAMVAQSKPLDIEALPAAVMALRHRGPDAQKWWSAPNHDAALGHARLAIIDLTTGDQPLANEDGSLHLVVNGELYDHERLRADLQQRGHVFSTRSDSEIVLHLYEEHGVDCLRELRGEFAFALWDAGKGRLFAARDRFGIKPLYYTQAGGRLVLASEVKALAAAGCELRWDEEQVFQNLFAGIDADRSLYAGVQQVPPGHYLLATRDSVEVRPYWDVNYPRRGTATQRSESEWIEGLRAQAMEAVRLRLIADVPVGCLLSGGLDSSAALGMARHFNPSGKLAAFTIAFDHASYDESPIAATTAQAVSADFHPIRVTDADFATHFSDAVFHAEALHYNSHGTARYLLSRAVRDAGYKVVLAGEGADEIGAGYHFCARALQPRGGGMMRPLKMLLRMLAPWDATERRLGSVSPWLVRIARLIGFPQDIVTNIAARLEQMKGLLAPSFAVQFAGRDPYGHFLRGFEWRSQMWGREPVHQALYLWLKSFFTNYVLAGERMDMAHAVELRLPFLDHHLYEFARDIPTHLYLREARQKWVLREAMAPFVPDAVRTGKKQPFMAPPSTLDRHGPLVELAQDTLRGPLPAFFDPKAIHRLLDDFHALETPARAAMSPVLLMLLSLCVLDRRLVPCSGKRHHTAHEK